MDVPPSRYRVEERGRRLVVIDRASGETVTGEHPDMDRAERPQQRTPAPPPMAASRPDDFTPPPPPPAPKRLNKPGGPVAVITTERWYDENAPRTLLIPDSARNGWIAGLIAMAALIFIAFIWLGLPVLFVIGFLLFQKGTRKGLRTMITGWLDGFEEREP